MHDTFPDHPDHLCLFQVATGQRGHFTAAQARACGFARDLLSYHARRGRFQRVQHGLYRFRDYPTAPHDEVVAAWLAAGKESAVVSHESALDLLDLSDVIPNSIHLTVSRARRYLPSTAWVTIHTTTRPLRPGDVIRREGVRLTSPTRTILDAAEAGTGPEQIELAIEQAIDRGLTTSGLLAAGAPSRGKRIVDLVASGLELATA